MKKQINFKLSSPDTDIKIIKLITAIWHLVVFFFGEKKRVSESIVLIAKRNFFPMKSNNKDLITYTETRRATHSLFRK